MSDVIAVCVAGATGWTGRAVAEAVLGEADLDLRSAVARSAAGSDLGAAWGLPPNGVPVVADVGDALDGVDVLVDYTSHDAAKGTRSPRSPTGVHVVIGSSGLTADDFAEIDAAARAAGVGVVAAGNFSLTAAMAQAAALLVGAVPAEPGDRRLRVGRQAGRSERHRPRAGRAARRGVATAAGVAVADTGGQPEARGATVGGTQVHSVRLPSFVVSTEVVFALPDERLVDPARRRRHARAVRRRHAARDPGRTAACRPGPRPRHPAARGVAQASSAALRSQWAGSPEW